MGKVTLPLAATLFAVPENVAATDYVCNGLREITSEITFEEEVSIGSRKHFYDIFLPALVGKH